MSLLADILQAVAWACGGLVLVALVLGWWRRWE